MTKERGIVEMVYFITHRLSKNSGEKKEGQEIATAFLKKIEEHIVSTEGQSLRLTAP